MSDTITIKERFDAVEQKIADACKRSGRNREDVTLLAVTKNHPVEQLKEAFDLGYHKFGENKVQELLSKESVLSDTIEWHMIGHLQRNKVKQIIDKVVLIHSVDSLRLAETIEKEAAKKDILVPILIEVNIAAEESKFGLKPEETLDFVRTVSKFPHIRIKGLMTSAPNVSDPEENRPFFKNLRNLAVDIDSESIDNVSMHELSMGMTGDYVVAIEEGATILRVGTALFGQRDYSK